MAGLVVITPAAGFVDPIVGAPVIGVAAGLVPFLACTKLKAALGYDDALDTFGVHAVGGTLGAILTGVLATASVNGNLTAANTLVNPELARMVQQGGLVVAQLKAVGLTLILALVGSTILAFVTKVVLGSAADSGGRARGPRHRRARGGRVHDGVGTRWSRVSRGLLGRRLPGTGT